MSQDRKDIFFLTEVDDLATHGNAVHVKKHGEAPEDI